MRFLSLVGNSFGCTASGERLVSAARDGDLQEAKALLDYNPRLARYSTFGVRNSPLHYSAAQGHHEIVSLLLKSGVDIDLRNYRGQTALMQACQYGHWEVVLILMLFRANIHKTDYLNGGTALHLAALNGHTQCIRLLLADHIPSIPNAYSILKKRSTHNESVSEFDVGSLRAIINKPADGGVTALHMAALNGHVETVHLLLELGASVSEVTLQDGATIDLIGAGSTPLHYAACGGNAQCCQLLIAIGASLTAENAKGWTPLMVARSWHRDWLEDILTEQRRRQLRVGPTPYLCLPLMSIINIARECGLKSYDSPSTCLDPCAVCLERKCTIVAEGCSHQFCTCCALYLCSTNTTPSGASQVQPGSIPCPLCRHGIVSFAKLPETHPASSQPMARTKSLPFCACSGEAPEQAAMETPFFPCARGTLTCQSFPAVKFSPILCLGAPDDAASPALVAKSGEPEARGMRCSSFRKSGSQNDGHRRWLCSFTQTESSY
ncbi:E3 ubiquitin-protein ligase XBAT32 [Andrographis paniculata]|uniref:E3 ubiquitin-protein ligase XBAT32 n=1 Tax=Andrographis paniculata TaxID=175694 RepID=UPI0021E95E10|nr:E3 ubiquitin-protein ligase XBAT32 [Andrographis paniculata]XP_051142480.1 E3 ubiquitin-protein ligase XBAT32 [Andrographis paniculata]XP_051142489.1 E3 ubiquitin-protein ligase XBAT32 [Andrographis paniculata]